MRPTQLDSRPDPEINERPPLPSKERLQVRVAPAPLGSGISFRNLPEPTLIHLTQTCQFYERKGAGNDKNVKRLLFDLSRDVQAIAFRLQDKKKTKIELSRRAREHLQDWDRCFLANETPSSIKTRMEELMRRAEEAENKMSTMKERHAKELKKRDAYVDDFTRVMRARQEEEIDRARGEKNISLESARAEFQKALKTQRRSAAEEMRRKLNAKNETIRRMKENYREKMKELQDEGLLDEEDLKDVLVSEDEEEEDECYEDEDMSKTRSSSSSTASTSSKKRRNNVVRATKASKRKNVTNRADRIRTLEKSLSDLESKLQEERDRCERIARQAREEREDAAREATQALNRLQESCRRCEAEISKLSGSLQMCRKKNLELKGVNEKQRSEILSLRDLVRTMQKSLDVYARWGANEMYSSDEEEDEEEEVFRKQIEKRNNILFGPDAPCIPHPFNVLPMITRQTDERYNNEWRKGLRAGGVGSDTQKQ